MAKIDCSVTVNYLQEVYRMCKYCDHECKKCPASIMNNSCNQICKILLTNHPDRAVEIVQKWSDEHPQKTRLEDLLEKYPNFELFSETGRPMLKPRVFGYCDSCVSCPNNKAEHCWNEPVDGGATGKAVE